MKNILILFAHPRYEKSRVNKALLEVLHGQDGITVHDLYEIYPDFNIDTAREQELLLAHQIIVWHYPLFQYGPPAMVKQWMDLVLEHGWAHGAGATTSKTSRFSQPSPPAARVKVTPTADSIVTPCLNCCSR